MTHEDYEQYLVEAEAKLIERYHAGRIGIEKVTRLLAKIHDWSEEFKRKTEVTERG